MDTIKCTSGEQAIKMLQEVKEYFQQNTDYNRPEAEIRIHLSMIDAVQMFLNGNNGDE